MSKFKEYIIEDKTGTIETVKGVDNAILKSLVDYMKEKGLKIDPIPQIRVVDNDYRNAQDVLGATGGYDPESKMITLFTLKRHPEDVLRSFCHEMVHHIQNLEGRLTQSGTNNVNKDPVLEQLEAEANKRGTMIFRSWKDNQLEKRE